MEREFTWRDGERTIFFRSGASADALEILRGQGFERFELLTTPRAVGSASMELAEEAVAVHYVRRGPVDEISAEVYDAVREPALVALGGGRVIDTAKAIAAVRDGRVAAIPTTLSGAEMTTIHRLPAGQSAPRLVRPALVVADPGLMATLPDARLRASAMNALAHGAEPLYTPLKNPVATMAALRGAELIARALDQRPERRDTSALSLGSLLCAYALDSALFAVHHVVCQTLVRTMGIPHAETNAAMLPRTMDLMRERAPEAIDSLAKALRVRTKTSRGIVRRIETLAGGPRRLSELGAERGLIKPAVEEIMARGELQMTPSPPDRAEVRALIDSAW